MSANAWILLASSAATFLAIAGIRRSPLARWLSDRPNERSLHSQPTPRVGGIGVMIGSIPAVALVGTHEIRLLALIASVLVVVSAMDDARSLPAEVRLSCHLAAAGLAVFVLAPAAEAWNAQGVLLATLVALLIAWMANLFNFMDGADGLAGGMAAIGFGALALAAGRDGWTDLAMFAGTLCAASVGFLPFNFPRASVFLGDAGSVPLGFLAGVLGWLGFTRNLWPVWFPLLVFSPFIVDATVTLARRLARHEPLFRAHRSHYYQRLVLGGWSHRSLAMAAWALMVASSSSALLLLATSAEVAGVILLLWTLAYGVLLWQIDRRHPRGTP